MNEPSSVDEIDHFLTAAARQPDFGETFLHVTLRHLVKAGRYATSLDDRFAHLIRATDGLIRHYEIGGGGDLLARLDASQKTRVRDIIKQAGNEIEILTGEATSTPEQKDAMQRIAQRVKTGCYTVEDKFGDAFVKLLEKFDLHDYEIANACFLAHPLEGRNSFRDILSWLRGDTKRPRRDEGFACARLPRDGFRVALRPGRRQAR